MMQLRHIPCTGPAALSVLQLLGGGAVFDDSIETVNDCDNMTVSAMNGANCRITNTVFFEGIPTLSQYGLAILALLMLGVGMVSFRRFV